MSSHLGSPTVPSSSAPTATITNSPAVCSPELEPFVGSLLTSPRLQGLIALGPTLYERDILNQCCRTLDTQLFIVNSTGCLWRADCPVQECALSDPAYACVSMLRNQWDVNGTFACVPVKKSNVDCRKAMGTIKWMVVAMVLIFAAMSSI